MTIYQTMKAYRAAHAEEVRLVGIIAALNKKLDKLRPEHSQAQAACNKAREVMLQTIADGSLVDLSFAAVSHAETIRDNEPKA